MKIRRVRTIESGAYKYFLLRKYDLVIRFIPFLAKAKKNTNENKRIRKKNEVEWEIEIERLCVRSVCMCDAYTQLNHSISARCLQKCLFKRTELSPVHIHVRSFTVSAAAKI